VILPLLLSFFATLAAAVMAYGIHPGWVHFSWGLGLIMLSERLTWPLIAVSLVLCLALYTLVISGKRRVWWLIGLAPVMAMFGHRFVTGPANRYGILDEPALVSADQAKQLADGDYVVGVVFNGEAYAYPYADLFYNPVVVQSDREKRILLMWNVYANAATVLETTRDLKARDLDIVSDPADSLLVYNTRTGQFIAGLTARSPRNTKLTGVEHRVPAYKETWRQWVTEHPETQVMMPSGRAQGPATPMPPRVISKSGPAAKTSVALIGSQMAPLAIPTNSLSAAPFNATGGDVPMVLFRDPATGRIRAFDRRIEKDLIPQFAACHDPKRKNVFMIDSDSNTGWSAAGVALDGDTQFKGHKLAPIDVQEDVYWGPVSFWYPNLTISSDPRLDSHGAQSTPAGPGLENGDAATQQGQTTKTPRKPTARRPRPGKDQNQPKHK
jgi:hypothetical protein